MPKVKKRDTSELRDPDLAVDKKYWEHERKKW
jgi:hypothetical protein